MSTIRFEAKHKFFKDMTKNFKNLTKSMAKAHQLAIGSYWNTLELHRFERGPTKPFIDEEYDVSEYLTTVNALHHDVFQTSWVKVDGCEYKEGLLVCTAVEDELPVFCKIVKILFVDNDILFLVQEMMTDCFSEHFHAFKVLNSEERYFVLKCCDLHSPKCFAMQNAYGPDNELYIVPVHCII